MVMVVVVGETKARKKNKEIKKRNPGKSRKLNSFTYCWWQDQIVEPFWKFPKKLNMLLPYNLQLHSWSFTVGKGRLYSQQMFGALFVIAKNCKKPRGLSQVNG